MKEFWNGHFFLILSLRVQQNEFNQIVLCMFLIFDGSPMRFVYYRTKILSIITKQISYQIFICIRIGNERCYIWG